MAFLAIRKFLKRNDGATAIEYGLIAAGIAFVILPAIQHIGTNLSATVQTLADATSADPCGGMMGGGMGECGFGGGGGGLEE